MERASPLADREVVLGVCGSIAAYKACELARLFLKDGARLNVIMTPAATNLVAPRTFSSLTREHVSVDPYEDPVPATIPHVSLAERAELVVIAPATANTMAKLAVGICDNMLTTTVCATRAPVIIAPAMNPAMWQHPTTARNAEILAGYGYRLVRPGVGDMACGDVGRGRLADLPEIVAEAERALSPQVLAGRRVLVSAGATREAIDPLRFVSNRSSGKMGMAIAYEAWLAGASVTLVAGAMTCTVLPGPEVIPAESAAEMHAAVLDRIGESDAYLGAAAVGDFTPAVVAPAKVRKAGRAGLDLAMVPTRDILADVCRSPDRPPLVVGFAAETEQVEERGAEKLARKGCDLVVANLVGRGGVMGSDETQAVVLDRDGVCLRLAGPKRLAARALVALAAERLAQR